ncbi:hypothetical protein [Caulobacter sp. S45]|uniref:hypothetical protein n=1 Tax=Caulobacter sp. S45 TaxID=1641861 RepID=UPI00131B3570|nr:hypothetical protein [Caulobacter sp. S45]
MSAASVLAELDGKPALSPADALAARSNLYGQSAEISRGDAEAIFKLNANAGSHSQEWRNLFVEVITDYVVRQTHPVGYVDDDRANWLISTISSYPRIREDEVELLLHILDEADQTPGAFETFILNMLKALTLWRLKRNGRLERVDVERLRRAVFGKGSDANDGVSRKEAEILFDINDALGGADAEGWSDFFIRAVANAILFESPWKPDANKELAEEAWIADHGIHPFRRIEAEAESGHFLHDVGEGFHEVVQWDFHGQDLAELGSRVAADQALEAAAEAVTEDEEHWLLGRIGLNGRVDANEQALIEFVVANAHALPPDFMALVQGLQTKRSSSETGLNPTKPSQPVP